MSCSDYQEGSGCDCVNACTCNMIRREKECLTSKSGFHCWHNPVNYSNGYTLTVTYYPAQAPDPTCCFCGVKESQLHGPYHPQNTPKWNQAPIQWGGITGGTISIGGNTTGSWGTLWTGSAAGTTITFTTGSGYTYTIPVTNGTISTNPYITTGYSNSAGNATTLANVNGTVSCTVAGCVVCKSFGTNTSGAQVVGNTTSNGCVNGCNGTTTGCTLCPRTPTSFL